MESSRRSIPDVGDALAWTTGDEAKEMARAALNRRADEREFIAQELTRVITAGNALAEAAHRVSATYDGVHRLRLALAGWYTALANEGGRAE